jgi:Leucine-rich repeat (LRR) protein
MKPSPLLVFRKLFFSTAIFLLVVAPKSVAAIPPSERAALEALYYATDGDNWTNNINWLSGLPEDQWEGITVSNGSVTKIILPNNKLKGPIPPEISQLTKLNILILSGNFLSGPLPIELFSLSGLGQIQLANNLLSGSIPPLISQLRSLTALNISLNQISGSIPNEIDQLSNLKQLILSNNQLEGNIPDGIGNLTKLTNLELQNNQLTGNIPTTISQLTTLNLLNFNNNLLTGQIPDEIFGMSSLTGLYLSNNKFEGEIPSTIGQLINLQYLNLQNCNLSGPIPPEIGQLTKLSIVILSQNKLTGSLPEEFLYFPSLSNLTINNNQIENIPPLTNLTDKFSCGNNRLEFDDLEPNATLLKKLPINNFTYSPQAIFGEFDTVTAVDNAPFTLTIPCSGSENNYRWYKNGVEFGTTSGPPNFFFNKVTFSDTGSYHIIVTNNLLPGLTLTSNPVYLNVAEHCLKNDSLALVALYNATGGPSWTKKDNWLTGPVSTWHGIGADSCNVLSINLNGNNLTGSLPNSIENLDKLEELIVTNNHLSGQIPAILGNLSTLKVLHLDDNDFSGAIPAELWNLIGLQELLLNLNPLQAAEIPAAIGKLTQLQVLGMAEISLQGEIPPQLYTLTNLWNLALYGNNLTGTISNDIKNLTNLQNLYFNLNQLEGSIPTEIGNLNYLTDLAVNDNFFDEMPSLSNVDSMLYCEMNKLTFEDFERNIALHLKPNFDYKYSPQLDFGREYDTTVSEGNSFYLSIPCGGVYNHYKWFKDGVELPTYLDSSTLFFPRIALSDSGYYHITVTNDSVRNLELKSLPIHLHILEHCLRNDSLALVALYNATNGPDWINNENWLTGPVNNWYGIQANECNVLKIELEENNLNGTLPPELFTLEQLDILSLSSNNLSGEIPSEIGNLTSLYQLYFDGNKLTGLIPSELWNLTTLGVLWLSKNNFSEEKIPAEIKNLTNVYRLGLAEIQRIGTIPPEVWELKNLQYLALYGNQLTGRISPSVENLTNLIELHLNNNLLSGEIPAEIGKLSKLSHFVAARNQLTGTIPAEFGDLKNLKSLHLENNKLSGTIPVEIGNTTMLSDFYIANNEFTGAVPTSMSYLNELRYFAIDHNLFADIPELTQIDSMFVCSNNYLTFEDFEKNLDLFRKNRLTYTYSPQYDFGREYDTIAFRKYPFTLSIPCGGLYNHYTWYKDGEILPNAPDASTLTIPRVDYSDAGVYHITVTNDSVPLNDSFQELILTSLPITVIVEKGPPLELKPVNLVINDGSRNTNFWIDNIDDYPDNNLVVFSRWGKKVYEKNGYNNELDFSTYPHGTYYYVLSYHLVNGDKRLIKSFVDVIKK